MQSMETLRLRWLQVVFLAIAAVLLVVGFWFFQSQKKAQQKAIETNLLSVAKLKIQEIQAWRSERIADAAIMMGRKALIGDIRRYFRHPAEREISDILRRLRDVKGRYHYADIWVVDPDRQIRLSLGPKPAILDQTFDRAYAVAVVTREPVWTDLHTGHGPTPAHLSVVAPFFATDSGGDPIGAIVLICDPAQFLYPLIQSWPTASQTAESLLIRRDGDDVLFLNELRHQTGTALNLRISLHQSDLPAAVAITGHQGIVAGRDYRGAKVIAAVLPVPGSPWFMVSKIDAAEAFAEWRFRSVMILTLLIAALSLVGVVIAVLRQRNLKDHYRKLYQSETALNQALMRHRVTLQAIGDAVISTDAAGLVELMNPIAESLTGWRQEEAHGKPLNDVFRIINETTRLPLEDPVDRVLKEGRVVGLANHTLLIARDGREIPIADSGSPIRDEQDRITGVVLVFKDQTDERAYLERILEREEQYRLLADNTLDVIWTMDPDLVFTYVNPAIEALTGYLPEEWIGSRLPEHCDDARFMEMADIIQKEIAKGPDHKGVYFETEMHRRDGSPIPVEIHGKVTLDAQGSLVGLQGVTRDITQRQQTEQALAKSEALLRGVVDAIPDLVWLKDPDGVYLSCNRRFERFFGAEESDIVGRTDYDFVDRELADFFREHDRKAMAAGRPCANEEFLTFAENGYQGHFETIKTPMQDSNGDLSGVLGIARDISERKTAENALRENEQRYKSAQQMGRVGNWEFDIHTETFWGSDEAKRMFGVDALQDHFTVEELARCVPEGGKVLQARKDLVKRGIPYDIEYEIHPLDGSAPRMIHSIAKIERDNTGTNARIVGVIQDITSQKDAEKERHKLEAQLHQSQKLESVGRLAGGVAHDFNNIVSVIIGYAELAIDDIAPDDPLYGDLKEIVSAALRSRDITRQLLAFARRETIAPTVLDLNATVANLLKMLRRLIGEDIDLVWHPAPDLWPIKMDPSQLDQILANLCVNARDAIKDVGKVTIATETVTIDAVYCAEHPESKPGDFVMLIVSDDGAGMDREVLDKIFEPFFTTKGIGRGTGLGLATVYGIVKQNEGFIDVCSERDEGTSFRIYLPRHAEDAAVIQRPSIEGIVGGKGETVLITEDDQAILKLTALILKPLNYTVLMARSPREAIARAEAYKGAIDLLVTDVVMPDMNGRELSDTLARICPHLRTLFMSGYTADVIAHRGVLDSDVHFIHKPFSKQALAAKVREALDAPAV